MFDYCNCSCLELDTTLHHIQLQLLIVLCWIVTMTMAHIGVEKARGIGRIVSGNKL